MNRSAVEHTRTSVSVMIGREGVNSLIERLSADMAPSLRKRLEEAEIINGKIINFPKLVPLVTDNNDTRKIISDHIKNEGLTKVVQIYSEENLDKVSKEKLKEARIMINDYLCLSSLYYLDEQLRVKEAPPEKIPFFKKILKAIKSLRFRKRESSTAGSIPLVNSKASPL